LTDIDLPAESRGATPERLAEASAPVLVRAIPLAIVLLVAAELRLLFRTGMVHIDSLVYAHLAPNLAPVVSRPW